MTTVSATVAAALSTVLANSWAMELPPDPAWPAAVWEIDTTTEDGWCQGGGYDQHSITVVLIGPDLTQLERLLALTRTAFEALPSFMFEDSSGDGSYEDDPNVYAKFILFRLRSSRY